MTPGTIGPTGLMEKDLCLDLALRVGKLIETRLPAAEVVYTRSDDTFVPLEQRTALANSAKADLFLSIHANSSDDPKISGIETYYLNFNASPGAMDVAARENATAQGNVHDLEDMVEKIARNEKIEESRDFATDIQNSLAKQSVNSERSRGVRKAPFVVLIGADMPSVLAEVSFLSNPAEELSLKKPENRQRIAEGLYRGIRNLPAQHQQPRLGHGAAAHRSAHRGGAHRGPVVTSLEAAAVHPAPVEGLLWGVRNEANNALRGSAVFGRGACGVGAERASAFPLTVGWPLRRRRSRRAIWRRWRKTRPPTSFANTASAPRKKSDYAQSGQTASVVLYKDDRPERRLRRVHVPAHDGFRADFRRGQLRRLCGRQQEPGDSGDWQFCCGHFLNGRAAGGPGSEGAGR